ncbi:MAG TPA: DUF2804 domain-containing protein [Acidimicrobiia bacterium]
MATHERELTEPVDLATADGRSLNPAARGWSRRPLHRANLRGDWGRTKRWDYWAILAGDLVVSSVYADVDYLGLADVWWVDLATGHTGGRGIVAPFARGMRLPDVPATAPLHVARRHFELDISDDADGTTHLRARWDERDGSPARLDASIALPVGHESLNVVIPWSDRRFQFTSKHQARPAHGELVVGDRHRPFGRDSGGNGAAWGVLDVGRGRWPYRTRWNWGGGAGATTDGRIVGIQIGGRWTEGTGFTENGVIVDGVLTKLGTELRWQYDWDEPTRPWLVDDPHGRLHLRLDPRFDKHSKTEAGVMGTETHQVFGTWSGTFVADDGESIELAGIQGFAEESRSRW